MFHDRALANALRVVAERMLQAAEQGGRVLVSDPGTPQQKEILQAMIDQTIADAKVLQAAADRLMGHALDAEGLDAASAGHHS